VPARILLVDDYHLARAVIRSLLDGYDFRICAEAQNGREAVEKVVELKPDVVLLDINMPVMNGIQAAVEIRRIAPATKIVFVTNHDIPIVVDATRNVADGFVSKSSADTQLISTLRRVVGTSLDG
jgi:DNA-binding NarL/FixJ family response regulator